MKTLINSLMLISQLIAKRSEVIVAFVVIGVVFIMILPLPTALVDILIALNISISAFLVILALYLPGPLAFSTFPALLLITTFFRLALSITTTRLILLQGDAGYIVEAFGNFVVGGNLVVGLVIFLILLIVNFMVITKGAERIAEVSARFTLDAMPGKQMSIDSDLRAGLLTPQMAQEKRKSLAKESQMFGAMDGAMKFVKGDSIAGIIIVVVNILGGFSIGVLQLGLPTNEAIVLYSILTIGDGLVAQIPALLIALTAGMITTRVKDDVKSDVNVGQEMAQQLSYEPKAWIISSIVLIGFAIIPGMPTAAFIVIAFIFLSIGSFRIFHKRYSKFLSIRQTQWNKMKKANQKIRDDIEVNDFWIYERMSISYHESLFNTPLGKKIEKSITYIRNKIVHSKGFMLPSLTVHIDNNIRDDYFVLRFYEVPVVEATIAETYIVVENIFENQLRDNNIDFIQGSDTRDESSLCWIENKHIDKIKELNIPYKNSLEKIMERTEKALLQGCHQFIGIEEAQKILKWISIELKELHKEIEKLLPPSKFADIIKNLVSESVSIKSLRKICEILSVQAATERDIDNLTEIIRISLREQICNDISVNKNINVILIEPETEEILRDSLRKTTNGGYFSLSQEDSEHLLNSIINKTETHLKENKSIALVAAQDLRRCLRNLIKTDLFELPVLSYSELSPSIKITPIDKLSL